MKQIIYVRSYTRQMSLVRAHYKTNPQINRRRRLARRNRAMGRLLTRTTVRFFPLVGIVNDVKETGKDFKDLTT